MKMNKSQRIQSDLDEIVKADLPWDRFEGRRVLVTGAGGFIGGFLVRTLLALNETGILRKPVHVVGGVRNITKAAEKFSDIASDKNFEVSVLDLNKIEVPDIKGCQYIFHVASQASPRYYISDPVGTILPNSVGTASLLKALDYSGDQDKAFLFVSSSEVYGGVTVQSIDETAYGYLDPVALRSSYAESKRLGEALCVAWNKQYGTPTYIARPFHTYGPGLTPDDGRVFCDLAFNVARGLDIHLKSDGSARRAYCYITDAVIGLLTVFLRGNVATPYNVANSMAELSVLELAEMLIQLYSEKGLCIKRKTSTKEQITDRTPFEKMIPDISRLMSLGWAPSVEPADGFVRFVDWCEREIV